ncbi:MAG: hypothetical protein QOD99_2017 [Chthoniobacter sp.]|jgi:hypothetical protein|nr:hypothetical protein [Chthoniobacter sp.]
MKFTPALYCAFTFLLALARAALAENTEQWGVYEVALKGPGDGNPFLDVRLSATFTDGTHSHEVEGFYDGDGMYRVRFMPEAAGEWRYETTSNRWPLTGKTGTFSVTAASPKNHGPVRVHNTYHFAYADGTPFRQIGTTSYSWCHQSDALEEQTLKTLAGAPFNKIRMCVLPRDPPMSNPQRFPFAGTPPKQWDFAHFDPLFFQHLEKRVGQLRDLGIEADLILFHPYGKQWGFDTMDAATDDRYVRYVVARFAAFRNVWWSLANEYDFVRTKTEADWDRFFQIVQAGDPYAHLRSIHNGARFYNNAQPWVTHASIQNGAAVEEPGRAELYRDVWRKPVVYDEVKYEGNIESRWGRLTGQEMVDRFWAGTVAGTYVGHSECLKGEDVNMWLGGGGVLRGESPTRLAFLRQVLDDAPADGIEPIDKWQDSNMGGQPGVYYLLYFGQNAPKWWTFRLPKSGVTAGMKFKAEILDTWAMTVTPVEGEFATKKKDNYSFVDEKGRSIALPAKPALALRIRRVEGKKTGEEVPVE